jgi:zinc and cadmium transporter
MGGSIWLQTLGSVLLVSAIPLIGVLGLTMRPHRVQAMVPHLMSFAVGALLGGASLHLMPAAVERLGTGLRPGILLLAGFLGFFVLERFLGAHGPHDGPTGAPHPIAIMSLVGDGLHNLLDGIIIASSFLADPKLGVATSLAVVLHEVPQEIGDFGILLHSGVSLQRAILFNLLSGLTAVVGAALTLLIGLGAEGRAAALLPVVAGGFLYIAAADLVPTLHRTRGTRATLVQVCLILAGIGLLLLAALPE